MLKLTRLEVCRFSCARVMYRGGGGGCILPSLLFGPFCPIPPPPSRLLMSVTFLKSTCRYTPSQRKDGVWS